MAHPLGPLALLVPAGRHGPIPGQLEELETELTARALDHHRVDLGDDPAAAVRAAIAAGSRYVVACGVQDVAVSILPALVDPDGTSPDVVLGLFPGGRVNDFAHTFGLGLDPDVAAALLAGPRVMRVDVGVADLAGRRRLVLNDAVVGLGASAARSASRSGLRRLLTWWSTTALYRRPLVDVDMTFAEWHGRLVQAHLANGQYALDHLHVAPLSLPDDGAWDVQVWSGPRHLPFTAQPRMLRGEHLPHEHISQWRHVRVAMTAHGHRSVPVAIDGRPAGQLPATFTLLPKALRLKI